MFRRPAAFLFLLGTFIVAPPCRAERTCYAPAQVGEHAGKEICLNAHVYAVIESEGGTRYLDVCPASSPDSDCRLTVISLPDDRKSVGSLEGLKDKDIHLRGVVHAQQGRYYVLLSDARQLHGGAEKFRPNPALMHGFSADNDSTAFRDPAMSSSGRRSQSVFKGTARAN